ncbi:hypothetical protein B6U81_04560 [Thermoplasmatales archaeon ex4484_30]|nr:MAG: hypothetical protein B6U81_04560 [Thermoplasmatales archaeon ex4484_30]
MVKVAGIDLAGKEKNPTGICILGDKIELFTLYKNDDIIECISDASPQLVAIDAPLMEGEIRVRDVDMELKKYGAMPPTMKSMRELCLRGIDIVKKIPFPVIEVFPTASAKIMGFYEKDYKKMANLLGIKPKNEHEMDAYIAALTGRLYLKGKAIEIGKKEKVVIPLKSARIY